MKIAVRITLVFGAIALFLWNSLPRLMSEVWHARDFVPAQSYTITDYKCTNWNVFIFHECTVTFVSLQNRKSQQITDWRLGRAPHDPVRLLQRRDDMSSVTTDVSLRTLWNRVLLALMLVGFGVVLAIALVAKTFKVENAPAGAPGSEPKTFKTEDAPAGAPSSEPKTFKFEDAPVGTPSSEPALKPIGRSTFGKRQALRERAST